jgi:membrane protease YdiL (CAAX protease family)
MNETTFPEGTKMRNPGFSGGILTNASQTSAWLMLFSRTFLFAGFQALIALIYLLLGYASPWQESTAWWLVTATLTNLCCIFLLTILFRKDKQSYWDLFRFRRDTWKKDLLTVLGTMLIIGPLGFLPNVLLGNWLFGSQEALSKLFILPLPLWAILPAVVLMPVSIALAELPTYFAFVQPRLETRLGRWVSVILTGLMLSVQHITLPLIFNGRFILFRLLVFLPFAMLMAFLLRWRRHLLPYYVIMHGLMDLSVVVMTLLASL